jgi:hypothetical protein
MERRATIARNAAKAFEQQPNRFKLRTAAELRTFIVKVLLVLIAIPTAHPLRISFANPFTNRAGMSPGLNLAARGHIFPPFPHEGAALSARSSSHQRDRQKDRPEPACATTECHMQNAAKGIIGQADDQEFLARRRWLLL